MSRFKKYGWLLLPIALGVFIWTQTDIGTFIGSYLNQENLKAQIESFGAFGPLVFMATYFVVVMAFVSSTVFTILGGLLFGKLWGSLYVIIAATTAAQVAFMVGRKLSGDKIEALKNKRGIGKLIKTIEEKSDKNGVLSIIILRALFLPYIALSYAAGTISTLKGRDFFLGTLLTNIVFVPAFVYLGESLLSGPKALIIPGIMILLVLSVPRIVKRFQSSKLAN